MNYIILTAQRPDDLEDKVNERMKEGYVPLGGVSHSSLVFIQAMYLKDIDRWLKDK